MKQELIHQCQRLKEATFGLPRAALHFPVGLFVGWLTYSNVPAAYLLGVGFLAYEIIEDYDIGNRGYKDVFGYLFGLGAYVLIKEVVF